MSALVYLGVTLAIIAGVAYAIVPTFVWRKLFGKSKSSVTKSKLDCIVISGPSGVGKGTLINKLLQEFPSNFGFSVSHTSRAMREGERNGVDYHFVSKEEIQRGVSNNEFIEMCEYAGNMYGTSKAAVQQVRREGKVCIVEMDVQGAQKMKKQGGQLSMMFIFIKAPSLQELEARLRGRGQESEEKITTRLKTAEAELEFLESHDDFFDKVLMNRDLDTSYSQLKRSLKLFGAL